MSDSIPRPIAIKSPSPTPAFDTHSIVPSLSASVSSSTAVSAPMTTPSIGGQVISRLLPLANDSSQHQNLHNHLQQAADLAKDAPITICTSKKWVLPPRPKPGRKPSSANSHNNNGNNNSNNNNGSGADSGAKRKNQNRAAQKAYRERKAAERKMIEQESKSAISTPASVDSNNNNTSSSSSSVSASATPNSNSTTSVSTPPSGASMTSLPLNSSITNSSISTSIFIDQQLQTKNQEIASLKDVIQSLRAEIKTLKKQQFCRTCNSNLKSNPFLFDEIDGGVLPHQQLTIVPLKKRARNNSSGASIIPRFKKLNEIDFNSPPYSSHNSTITPISPESDLDDEDIDDLNDLNDTNIININSSMTKKRKKRIKKKRIDPCGFCSNGTPCLCEEAALQEAALQAFVEDEVELTMTI